MLLTTVVIRLDIARRGKNFAGRRTRESGGCARIVRECFRKSMPSRRLIRQSELTC
jgi:hypothetical protein